MDPLTMMILGQLATTAAGALGGGSAQAAPAAPPPPTMKGNTAGPAPQFADIFNTSALGEPKGAGMSFTPSVDPTAQAAATLTAAGAQPPVTSPVAGKPATAMPDRAGASMLPNLGGGDMAGYYNDTPDPSQPLTAAGTMTPGQKQMGALSQGLSGLQDVVVPESQAPRPPSAVSPPGPTVRPDMSALMQMITAAGQRPQDDPRKAGLAAMLMRG